MAAESFSQQLADILSMVERGNVSLRVYSARCEAARYEANTGITLADPEVEFGYLWGTPGEIGSRKDLSVTQSFDFATVFGARRREAKSREALADLECLQARNMVFFAAQQLVVQLTAENKAIAQQEERLGTARQLEEHYRKLLQQGEINKIEMGKAQLSRVTMETTLQRMKIERHTMLERLQTLCDSTIDYVSTVYPVNYLNGDRSISISRQEETVAQQQVEMARAEALPELKAGYMSELTKGEKFRGITVGVSIPLWKNRNNVSRAKAQQVLAKASSDELMQKIEAQKRELRVKATGLHQLMQTLQTALSQLNATPLMRKALDAGEISLIEYIDDRTNYYELQNQLLDTEKEYQQTLAELAFFGE